MPGLTGRTGRTTEKRYGRGFVQGAKRRPEITTAPEETIAAPRIFNVILENEFVKVIDIRMKSGEISPMHAHATPYLTYVLAPCKMRYTSPDGEVEETAMQPGDVHWHNAEIHHAANFGDTDGHILFVGVKEQSAMMTAGKAIAPPAAAALSDFRLIFENDAVRVAEVRMRGGAAEPMHSHRAGYVAYPLSPCKLRFTSSAGRAEEVSMDAGEPQWHEPETHQVQNVGATECRVLVVEMKR
ncbi:hypothetical protein LPW11_20360 [Geomonas sp. RF6]|uniref:hypothetical protein n=1 Tax=Geomonas sp. RF6 TaxID=2897342 RepID=UPI001E3D8E4E|nr:hypothetical protein [Geomonas sp. RF6]UFS70214.1 hypothetical protein LPW11_20360 [Geomonas sp. RF6]